MTRVEKALERALERGRGEGWRLACEAIRGDVNALSFFENENPKSPLVPGRPEVDSFHDAADRAIVCIDNRRDQGPPTKGTE